MRLRGAAFREKLTGLFGRHVRGLLVSVGLCVPTIGIADVAEPSGHSLPSVISQQNFGPCDQNVNNSRDVSVINNCVIISFPDFVTNLQIRVAANRALNAEDRATLDSLRKKLESPQIRIWILSRRRTFI